MTIFVLIFQAYSPLNNINMHLLNDGQTIEN